MPEPGRLLGVLGLLFGLVATAAQPAGAAGYSCHGYQASIVGIGNLCLSGALHNGSDSADEVGGGWGLTDDKIIELIQRHPFKGDEIIKVMTQQETCNVERVEYVMGITAPLLDGVL